jgi:hypothetical protein
MSQSTTGDIMPLTITPERFAAIREKMKQRRAEKLVAEIATTDWTTLAHFHNVDDFLKHLDALVEPPKTDHSKSGKHRS